MKHWNNNLEINPETIEILRHQNLATEQDSDGQSLLNQLSPKQHPQTPYQQPQQTGHIQKLSKQVMDISKALLGEREHVIQLECKTNHLEMDRHNLEQKNKKLMELLYCMQLYRKGQNIEIKRLKSDQEVIKNQLHQEQREIIEGFCQKLSITMKQIDTDDPAYWLKIQLDHIMVDCQKKEEYNVLEQIKVIFERETKSEMPIFQLEQFKNHIQKVVHELIEQQQPIYQINYLNDLSISLSKCELQKLISKDYEQLSDTVNYFNRQSKQILSSFSKSIKEISQKSFGYLNTQNILSDYNNDLNNILQPNQLGIKQTEELQQLLQTNNEYIVEINGKEEQNIKYFLNALIIKSIIMNNRDPIIEEKQGFLTGMLGAFASKTETIINNTMDEVNKVVQAGKPKPSLEQEISQIQATQQNFIIMLIIQFSLALVVIGIFLFIELVHIFQSVAFIVWAIFLIVYILTLAIAQFSGETIQKNPQNVFLFSVNTILRILWMSYLVVLVQFIKFELITLIFLIDLVLILIFFKIDQNSKINNCFLVTKQPWRLTFIFLGELLLIGLILPIEDFPTAFLWAAIIFIIYAFILLDIQLIEWRKFMRTDGNAWLLATACFDSDIIFPCFFLQNHCNCLELGNHSIMRD